MNLDELRLRALLSLNLKKGPAKEVADIKDTNEQESVKENEKFNGSEESTSAERSVISENEDEKEEGEISDDELVNDPDEGPDEATTDFYIEEYKEKALGVTGEFYRKRPRFSTYNNNNAPFYKRSRIQYSDESGDSDLEGTDLDTFERRKGKLLQQLDLNLALISALEAKEAELLEELKECRRLRSKSDTDKWKIDRKLERIEKKITVKMETEMRRLEDGKSRKFLRNIIGEMYRDTYCRSLSNRFPGSKLQKMYIEGLDLDGDFGSDGYKDGTIVKIDPLIPICPEELSEGRCENNRFSGDLYAEEDEKIASCPFQHLRKCK